MADPLATPAQLKHLKLLRRTSTQLLIGSRPFAARDLFLRVLAGIITIVIGIQWWSQSWGLGLLCLGIGLYLGFPTQLGETLIFDKPKDRVRRIQHRFWVYNPVLFEGSLSEIAQVRMDREASNRYAEGEYSYHCQVILILTDGESVVIGDYTSQSHMAMPDQEPREITRKMVGWIQKFLDLPQTSRSR